MFQPVYTVAVSGVLVSAALAGDAPGLVDEADRINYSLGYQIGADLRRQGVALNADALMQGLQNALAGESARLGDRDMQQLLEGLKHDITESVVRRRKAKVEATRQQSSRYLAKHAQQDAVQTTPSGLQYRVLRAGSGATPGLQDRVNIRYRARLVDGRVFDSTDKEGASFRVADLIKGLQEGLQLMRVGARWELTIPPNLGFRRRGGPLEHEVTIYDLELVAIE